MKWLTKGRGLLVFSIVAGAVLVFAISAAGQAKSGTQFGSKLTKHTQPSNGAPGLPCAPHKTQDCTFVLNEAYAPPNPDGKQLAPKDGTINKISLIAATKGKFRLQVVKLNKNQHAKVVKQGPTISYVGTPLNGNTYNIENFKVDVPIKKGEQLAAKASKISFVRCSSGGPNTLIYQPALSPGGSSAATSGSDGCWMLLEATYK